MQVQSIATDNVSSVKRAKFVTVLWHVMFIVIFLQRKETLRAQETFEIKVRYRGWRRYQAFASLTLIYPSFATSEDQVMKILMPAGGRGVALRATLVRATPGGAAIADRILARDDAVFASAASAGIAGLRHSLAVHHLSILEPATC